MAPLAVRQLEGGQFNLTHGKGRVEICLLWLVKLTILAAAMCTWQLLFVQSKCTRLTLSVPDSLGLYRAEVHQKRKCLELMILIAQRGPGEPPHPLNQSSKVPTAPACFRAAVLIFRNFKTQLRLMRIIIRSTSLQAHANTFFMIHV